MDIIAFTLNIKKQKPIVLNVDKQKEIICYIKKEHKVEVEL